MTDRLAQRLVFLLVVTLTSACAGDAPPAAVERDSAGIRIVENAWHAPVEGWALGPARATIGGADPTEELFQVNGGTVLPDGRIVVVNSGSQEIRIYDGEGRPLERLGGNGDGPGEFRQPALAGVRGDTLIVYDMNLRRVTLLHPDAGVLGDYSVGGEGGGFPVPQGMFADGAIAFGGGMSFSSREGFPQGLIRSPSAFRAVPAPGGGDAVEYGEFPGAEMWAQVSDRGFTARTLPYGRVTVSAVGDSLFWIGTADAWELVGYGRDGRPRRIVRVAAPARPVTPDLVGRYVDNALESATDENQRRALRTAFAEMPGVEFVPPYGQLKIDALGCLWVADGQVPGEPVRWTVLDPAGRLIGRLEMPAGTRPLEIGRDYVLLRATDALGVEEVRLHGLTRPDA